MKSKKFEQAPARDEHIGAAVPATLKAKVFEVAAKQRLPASHVIREALMSYTEKHAA